MTLHLSASSTAAAPSVQPDLVLPGTSAPVHGSPPQLHDIYGPVALPDPMDWWIYALAATAALSIIALLYFIIRKRKNTPTSAPQPHVIALHRLEQAHQLLAAGQSIVYSERISEILRRYIEERFGIRSTRQTTREFFHHLHSGAAQEKMMLLHYFDTLLHCLEQCDLAKYAHMDSPREHLLEMERSVRRFIEETAETEES